MATQAEIDILIDISVRNFATEAFHDMALNRILHLMNQNGSGGAPSQPPAGYFPTMFVDQTNFTTATDCPIPALNGYNLAVFWEDTQRHLKKGSEWIPFVGGGFTILIPGFDATANNYWFSLTPALV
jgi:hypothetical protein